MKNLRILFVLLLTLLGASNVVAQEIADGEAFYIYRNDGDFDGFFYDQVEEMRYSKLGVDSVEYDEYVTYEVVTADSLYRIPLETIDSISFVQPEIEFNPEVRHMDLLGMSEYITAVDGMTLTFDTSLPFVLRPKEGNVLLGFTGLLEENGFGGRVQSVSVAGDKIIVSCGQLEKFSDIFKRFISVEEVGADENGKPLTRRIAGYRSMMESARRASDGLTTNLLDVSMNTHLKLLPDGFLYHANVDLSLALKIRLAMVYRVEADDAFFKVMLMESFSLQAGIDLGVDGSDFKKIACVPTFGIKFPAGLYLFEIRPVPEFRVRYGGDISFKAKFPSFTRAFRQTWVMDSSNSDGMRYEGNGMDAGPAQSVSEFFSDAGMGITFSGFVQVGIKTSCAVYTNSWVEKIFNAGVGVDFFIGPKVEGSILGVSGSVSDLTDGYYLLRNNKLSGTWLALDFEAFGEHQFCSGPKHRYTFADGSFALLPKWEMAMLPTVDMKKAEYKDGKVNAEMETNECCVFWNSDLGFAIMDKEAKNILASDYLQHFKFGSEVPFLLTTSFSVKDYKPGIYQVAPLMKMSLSTKEFPIRSQAYDVEIPPYIELSQKEITPPASGGEVKVNIKTNADSLSVKILDKDKHTITEDKSWVKPELSVIDLGSGTATLTLTAEKNDNLGERNGFVVVTASTDGIEVSDSLSFNQVSNVNEFKMYGDLSFIAQCSGSTHSWGYNHIDIGTYYEQKYEYDEETPEPEETSVGSLFGYWDPEGKLMHVTCSRSDNLLTISASGTGEPHDNYEGTWTTSSSWQIVIDLTEGQEKILSGTWTFNSSYHAEGVRTVRDELFNCDSSVEDYFDTSSYKESVSWRHEIPCSNKGKGYLSFNASLSQLDYLSGGGESSVEYRSYKEEYSPSGTVTDKYLSNQVSHSKWNCTNTRAYFNITIRY